MMTTLAEDIAAVRDYINEHGFYQGDFTGPNGSVCIRGAIKRVMHADQADNVYSFLLDIIGEEVPFVLSRNVCGGTYRMLTNFKEPIAYYNDEIFKDKQDALNFLDKARIRAEEIVREDNV